MTSKLRHASGRLESLYAWIRSLRTGIAYSGEDQPVHEDAPRAASWGGEGLSRLAIGYASRAGWRRYDAGRHPEFRRRGRLAADAGGAGLRCERRRAEARVEVDVRKDGDIASTSAWFQARRRLEDYTRRDPGAEMGLSGTSVVRPISSPSRRVRALCGRPPTARRGGTACGSSAGASESRGHGAESSPAAHRMDWAGTRELLRLEPFRHPPSLRLWAIAITAAAIAACRAG